MGIYQYHIINIFLQEILIFPFPNTQIGFSFSDNRGGGEIKIRALKSHPKILIFAYPTFLEEYIYIPLVGGGGGTIIWL